MCGTLVENKVSKAEELVGFFAMVTADPYDLGWKRLNVIFLFGNLSHNTYVH